MRNWIASLKSFTVNAIVLMSDYTPQGVDLTTTEANQTRLKIECNTILANYGKVYNSMLARLSDEEYHSTDIEISTFQISAITSALSHFQSLSSFGFIKSNTSQGLETQEITLLKSFLDLLKATPPSMTTIYLRDLDAGRGARAQPSVGGSATSSASPTPSSTRGSPSNGVTLRSQFMPSQINSFYR
jgi:hypothetical protein